jgi:hypothetical protein
MTELEIIEETVQYYNEDVSRRAYLHGMCTYYNEHRNMCAVGRCLIDPEGFQKRATATDFGSIAILVNDFSINLEESLKDEYKGHSLEFWEDLQSLHDYSNHWDSNGITEEGITYVEDLKSKYKYVKEN